MSYPSDISRKQFEAISAQLESARKKTKPRSLDLFEVFNAVLYVVAAGCQWRALPKDYPKWRSVHRYFQIWSAACADGSESVLEQVLKKIGRQRAYRQWQENLDIFYYHRRPKR